MAVAAQFPNLMKRLEAAHAQAPEAPKLVVGQKPAVINRTSINCGDRPGGAHDIQCVVLFKGEGTSAMNAAKRYQDPRSKMSVHYIVGANGEIVQCVADDKFALRVGPSVFRGRQTVDAFAISIEVLENGSNLQYQALIRLLTFISKTYRVTPDQVVEYRDVTLPKRQMPATFELSMIRMDLMSRLEEQTEAPCIEGFGLGSTGPRVMELQRALCEINYLNEITGRYDKATFQAVALFQHDVAMAPTGNCDLATLSAIAEVVASLQVIESAQPEAKKAEVTTYRVQDGDNLPKIALRVFGDANRWQEILHLNQSRISNPREIAPGMVLRVA